MTGPERSAPEYPVNTLGNFWETPSVIESVRQSLGGEYTYYPYALVFPIEKKEFVENTADLIRTTASDLVSSYFGVQGICPRIATVSVTVNGAPESSHYALVFGANDSLPAVGLRLVTGLLLKYANHKLEALESVNRLPSLPSET